MREIEEIRRENLRALRDKIGGRALSEKIQRDPPQISQWINGSINSGTGKPRNMKSLTARKIEEQCGLEKGWLDIDRSAKGREHTTAPVNSAAQNTHEYGPEIGILTVQEKTLLMGFRAMGEEGRDLLMQQAMRALETKKEAGAPRRANGRA